MGEQEVSILSCLAINKPGSFCLWKWVKGVFEFKSAKCAGLPYCCIDLIILNLNEKDKSWMFDVNWEKLFVFSIEKGGKNLDFVFIIKNPEFQDCVISRTS